MKAFKAAAYTFRKEVFKIDKESFVKDLMLYKDTVFRAAYSYTKNKSDAEDISQEVFLTFYTSDMHFITPDDKKAWLIRITINRAKDLVKSTWFSKRTEENILMEREDSTPEEYFLLEKVMELPDKYRIIIHLYYYEGYAVAEISEMTGIKPSTVQTRLQRGRKLLEKRLKEEESYEKRNIQFSI